MSLNTPLRWELEKSIEWYQKKKWLVGCNFIPSTAVNQLEMWQADTFDPDRIRLELSWAAEIGMNSIRVFLHNLAWKEDSRGLKKRISDFLEIADELGISVLLVLLDDCWNPDGKIGKQPPPIPGVHNSRWLQCPGTSQVSDPTTWPDIKQYVQSIIEEFRTDNRILAWDLYNEPGNSGMAEKSLPLLKSVFNWAREINPDQPLTVGLWNDFKSLNAFQLATSDIITFHHYKSVDHLKVTIQELKRENRPILCTEYMARTLGSLFETHLPVFHSEKIGCYNWGLVNGKTQTIYPWDSPKNASEPEVWFTDIFQANGIPYDSEEIRIINSFTQ